MTKRTTGGTEIAHSTSLSIDDLLDDHLIPIFEFVGKGHFGFVASVSTQFHRVYKTYLLLQEKRHPNPHSFSTTADSILESVGRFLYMAGVDAES